MLSSLARSRLSSSASKFPARTKVFSYLDKKKCTKVFSYLEACKEISSVYQLVMKGCHLESLTVPVFIVLNYSITLNPLKNGPKIVFSVEKIRFLFFFFLGGGLCSPSGGGRFYTNFLFSTILNLFMVAMFLFCGFNCKSKPNHRTQLHIYVITAIARNFSMAGDL